MNRKRGTRSPPFFGSKDGLCPAAELHRLDDALHRHDVGGLAHVDVVLLRGVEDRMVGGSHFFVQALVDILRLPVVHIKIKGKNVLKIM